jgi:hypothetical protein
MIATRLSIAGFSTFVNKLLVGSSDPMRSLIRFIKKHRKRKISQRSIVRFADFLFRGLLQMSKLDLPGTAALYDMAFRRALGKHARKVSARTHFRIRSGSYLLCEISLVT